MTAFEVTDLDLSAPEDGGKKLEHNDTFQTIAEGWNNTVAEINGWIGSIKDAVDWAGLDSSWIPTLGPEDLEGAVVYPLSGDYGKIRTNGNACKVMHEGFKTFGDNFRSVGFDVPEAIQGETGSAITKHLLLYDLTMNAVATVVRGGALAFEGLARVSESLAVAIEDTLVAIGKWLIKILGKLSSRFGGWFGWVNLCKDLVEHGLGVIQDIIDDVESCIHAIEVLKKAKDEVEEWARTAAATLKTFSQVFHAVQQLPEVTEAVLHEAPPDQDEFEKRLDGARGDFQDPGEPDITDDLDEADGVVEEGQKTFWEKAFEDVDWAHPGQPQEKN